MGKGETRVDRVPKYFIRKFPETRKQTLDKYLDKYEPFTWRGYEKTSSKEKAVILNRIHLGLRRKAELLKRIVGTYTTKKGRTYDVVEKDLLFIPTRRTIVVYSIETKRFAKHPSWWRRIR